jgi:hypothetical protein
LLPKKLKNNYPICPGGKIEKNETGGACGAYGGGERCAQGSGGGNLSERDHWGDPDVDDRIILRWIFRKWDWMELAQVRDRWRAIVSTVSNLRVPKSGEFLD